MVTSQVFQAPLQFCQKKVISIGRQLWNLWAHDRRRLLHSLKVGMALSLATLLLLLQDVYGQLSKNTIWAVMTVVVVFEFSLGATLSKGLNRGLGTILAAMLGLLIDHLAGLTGPKLEPYIIGFSVFFIGASATIFRFIPGVKAKYDYGVVIFLLTFCLVVVSGYEAPDNLRLALDRFVTVIIGFAICVVVSLLVFPVWAGNDLHNIIQNNIENLAGAVEECMKEYFRRDRKLERLSSKICKGESYADLIYERYSAVLNSKSTEESLANFATWETRCGRLRRLNPWKNYVQVGAVLRHCAYTLSALHCCLLSEIQAPDALREVFAKPCINISIEIGKVLRELGENLRSAKRCRPKQRMMENLNVAVKQLHISVNAHPYLFMNSDMWPVLSEGTLNDDSQNGSEISSRGDDDHDLGSYLDAVQSEPKTTKSDEDAKEAGGNNVVDRLVGRSQSMLAIETSGSMSRRKEDVGAAEGMAYGGKSFACNKDKEKMRRFAESLSLATVLSLLVEIVPRLEHLLNTVVALEEEADFKRSASHLSERSTSRPKTEQLIQDHTSHLSSVIRIHSRKITTKVSIV